MTYVEPQTPISLKKLLYLSDFSKASEPALPFAISIAREFGSTICAMHVVVPGAYAVPDLANDTVAIQQECAVRDMRTLACQFADVPHEIIVECGPNVWPSVERTIEDRSIDLIVLGTHGRTGLSKLLLGSVAEEIFRRSPIPVLTIGPRVLSDPHHGISFRCILLATDFSPESDAAVPYTFSFAQKSRASLILLHVVPERRPPTHENESSANVTGLHNLLQFDADSGRKTETIVRHGDPANNILEVANEYHADLIVLGVHGSRKHTDPATHLENATAHKVVSHATCPVLTVRSQQNSHVGSVPTITIEGRQS